MIKRNYLNLILLIVFGIFLNTVLFSNNNQEMFKAKKNDNGYIHIDIKQLEKSLQDKDFVLLNVHIPFQGNIPGTDNNIAFNDLDKFVKTYPNKKTKIVLYCRSGSMSRDMSINLSRLGYENILDLQGGSNSWKKLGYELLPKP